MASHLEWSTLAQRYLRSRIQLLGGFAEASLADMCLLFRLTLLDSGSVHLAGNRGSPTQIGIYSQAEMEALEIRGGTGKRRRWLTPCSSLFYRDNQDIWVI